MMNTLTAKDIKLTMEQSSGNGLTIQNIISAVNADEKRCKPFENIFFPAWDNKPPVLPAVLSLGGTPILSHQNSSAIIANPGMGKSSIIEAIPANFLNPGCDSLGFEVSTLCEGIIIIDNERTNTDVWNSFYRMCRRAGKKEGENITGVLIAGMRSVSRLEERKKIIEQLLQDNPCSLLLLDGAGDLVYDTNDLQQAIECRIWFRELTVKYDISILSTLHPNPNSNKPRGHQGSEICREAECVLLIKSHENDSRCITSDFEQGKNRNNPKLTTAFKWSEELKMFASADYTEMLISGGLSKTNAKINEARYIAEKVLPAPNALNAGELEAAVMELVRVKETAAKDRIKIMKDNNIIVQLPDKRWRLKI